MKKVKYLVVGFFAGKDYSKPGFDSYADAGSYATLKGWTDISILCEGIVEQATA